MSDENLGPVDKPYRIQTPSGYRKYLCSGLYMPSVTTVLSATETEKAKAGLRTWQLNNPGELERCATRGSAIHLGCENYLRGLDPGVPEEYQDFWNIWTGLIYFTGRSVHYAKTGTIFVQTIERLHMCGVQSIFSLDALIL